MADGNPRASAQLVISIVTPAFNEANNLNSLYRRLWSVMEAEHLGWEWITVDDHSADNTFGVLSQLAAHDDRVLGLRLARNVGSHAAILCGLAHSKGDAAIVLAADGEDPPEEIPRLIAEWRNGAAVVWAERRNPRGRSAYDRLASQAFHKSIRRWSNLDNLTPAGSDFFLVSQPVINVLNTLGERNTNVMALLAWIGFDQVSLPYEKAPRAAGRTGWTTAKKLTLFFDSVFGFSLRPVRAMSILGFVTATFGFLYAIMVVINAAFGRPVEGWSSLMVVVLVLGGIQMVMLGILGEYLWRALDESRSRPRYVVERRTDDLINT